MSQVKLIDVDIAWKGEKRNYFVERWIEEVIQN
jgi:hypothetical protein